MKKILFIILTLCSLNAFSQTLTVTRSGNTVLFIRSGQETIQVGANEFFDCFRNSNDTTKIIISHGRMNGSPIWDKTSIVSVGGVSSTGVGATDISRQIKDLVSALNTTPSLIRLVATSSATNTSVNIPTTFRGGSITWLNAPTGTVRLTTPDGNSTVLTSAFPTISFPITNNTVYTGYTLTLLTGATVQWTFNQ